MNEYPLVYVIIVTYNGRRHLEYSLPSLVETDYTNYKLVIVDNASTDDSVLYVKRNYPSIKIISVGTKNKGWSGGNNFGVRYAMQFRPKYITLFNNDIKVDPRWLKYAVNVAEERPNVGFIGFRTFGEGRIEDRDGRLFEEARADWQKLEVSETYHISGCALFIRTEVFERIGFIDEKFVDYGDDSDFERRGVKAGYKRLRINIPMWHYGMGHWDKFPIRASKFSMRNNLRYTIKAGEWRLLHRQLKKMCRMACGTASKTDFSFCDNRRMRPSNVFVNGLLLLYACVWNIIFLRQTLIIKRYEDEKIALSLERKFKDG